MSELKVVDASHIENGAQFIPESDHVFRLSEAHKQYLTQRHGAFDLDPLPEMDDADPYNWPQSKKRINLALVAFHAMMGTFTASSIQCALVDIAEDLGVSVRRASYLTSLVIAVIGVWWAILAFFICPAGAIGTGVVAEMFLKKHRAAYMGIWTVMITLGVPIAPFLFGFAAQRVGYRWIYWVLVIVNGVQLILYAIFGAETLYLRDGKTEQKTARGKFRFGRIDPRPLSLKDFFRPLTFALYPTAMVPTFAYAMVFLIGGIMPTIEIPQVYPEKYGLNTQEIGLQFLAVIIGSLIGEQIGGFISDRWMSRYQKKTGKQPAAEHRLWLSYIGHILTIVGMIVFSVMTGKLTTYNVSPVVGIGIAAAGNQIVTTVNITYAVDRHRSDATSIGVFITFVRQAWGFIGPFWFPQMFENLGFIRSTGIEIALIIGVSTIPTILLQWKGAEWR